MNSPAAPGPERPADTARSRRTSRAWRLLAVVLVVVVVAVAGLWADGLLTAHRGSSSPGPYETFEEALPAGEAAASGLSGGPWLAALAVGVALPSPVFVPPTSLSNSTGIAALNCSLGWVASPTASVLIPATPSTAGGGRAAFWLFGLRNSSGAVALTLVQSGTGAPLLVASGSTCEAATSHLEAVGSVVDSPAAVEAAGAAGGTAFLAAHPNATEIWAVFGGLALFGGISTAPDWSIVDTTCSLPTTLTATGATFNATVNAATGEVTQSGNTSGSCALGSTGVLSLLLTAPLDSARKAI